MSTNSFDIERRAEQLAQEKPDTWAYYLVTELLKQRLANFRGAMLQLSQIKFDKTVSYTSDAIVYPLVRSKLDWLEPMCDRVLEFFDKINQTFGIGSEEHDLPKINQVVDHLDQLLADALEWESDLARIHPSKKYKRLIFLTRGLTAMIVSSVSRLVNYIEKRILTGESTLAYRVSTTPDYPHGRLAAIATELNKLKAEKRKSWPNVQ